MDMIFLVLDSNLRYPDGHIRLSVPDLNKIQIHLLDTNVVTTEFIFNTG